MICVHDTPLARNTPDPDIVFYWTLLSTLMCYVVYIIRSDVGAGDARMRPHLIANFFRKIWSKFKPI